MFIPIPILVGAVAVILLLLVLLLRGASTGRRDLIAPPASFAMPRDLDPRVRALVDSGDKIEAIKLVRESTGLGLKESKELVEGMERAR